MVATESGDGLSKDWLAQAYVGGTGRRKAIDRDWFQIVAVIAKGT
jgi:hypothetical protein